MKERHGRAEGSASETDTQLGVHFQKQKGGTLTNHLTLNYMAEAKCLLAWRTGESPPIKGCLKIAQLAAHSGASQRPDSLSVPNGGEA